MAVLTRILNSIFVVLFVEAILFAPVVLMVAVAGKGVVRTLKYAVPFLVAIMPYIIWKRTKPALSGTRRSFVLMLLGLIVGVCFLLFFSGLMLASCAGHPPF
jgi:predicted neutral ceramidase superfamily lipid hydrolase